MQYSWRWVGSLLLLALYTSPFLLHAQDENTINVAGSGIVTPVLEILAEASQTGVTLNTTITGTTEGIARLCAGTADVVTSTRPISVDEDGICTSNGVKYTELLIGHDILALITQPSLEFAQCLNTGNLNTLLAPSTTGQPANWTQVNPENPDTPMTLFIPKLGTSIAAILDRLVEGDGFRADAAVQNSYEEIIHAVEANSGALGVVNLNTALAAGDTVKILSLDAGETGGCSSPSAENVEGRLYEGATRLFLYVNTASLSKTGLKALMDYLASDASAPIVQSAGFTAVSEQAYERNRAALQNSEGGRQFSQEVVSFTIPSSLTGTLNIGGAAQPYGYMKQLTDSFTGVYSGVTINYKVEGQPAGFRRLCNGEIDIALAYEPMTAEQATNCDANNINTETFNLGKQVVVLVANSASEYLSCLTTAQLNTLWNASSANTITTWKQVDSSFSDSKITLFTPSLGDSTADLLMTRIDAGIDVPRRSDTEVNADPLWRAAATANVEGALTYMTWRDYQRVLLNNQERIQLVGVNGGNGCITPSPETITSGSYPLSRPANLIVSRPSLSRFEVQSLLWYLASDENYSVLENAGYVGIGFGDLPNLRENLQRLFNQISAEAAAEVTPEPGAETTPEATPEATDAVGS